MPRIQMAIIFEYEPKDADYPRGLNLLRKMLIDMEKVSKHPEIIPSLIERNKNTLRVTVNQIHEIPPYPLYAFDNEYYALVNLFDSVFERKIIMDQERQAWDDEGIMYSTEKPKQRTLIPYDDLTKMHMK